MDDTLAVISAESDPQARSEMIASLQEYVIGRLLQEYERTAWELKDAGWNTGQISDLLEFSERRIKRLINDYSKRTGAWNPLRRKTGEGAVDISALVTRNDAVAGQASPSKPSDRI